MNKEEILKLHELSEEDAIGWLYDHGVLVVEDQPINWIQAALLARFEK